MSVHERIVELLEKMEDESSYVDAAKQRIGVLIAQIEREQIVINEHEAQRAIYEAQMLRLGKKPDK